jgi:hypothetical protein
MSAEHTVEATMPCGCQVTRDASSGQGIVFCAVHGAAPRLLAALEGLLPWVERGTERMDREEARAITQALASIREAKRES